MKLAVLHLRSKESEVLLQLSLGLRTFDHLMTQIVKRLSAILLVVLHLGAGFDLIIAHNHIFAVDVNSSTRLEAHTCGANEVHHNIPASHTCLMCVRSTLSVATVTPTMPFCSAPVVLSELPANRVDCLSGHNASCPKRGPPEIPL